MYFVIVLKIDVLFWCEKDAAASRRANVNTTLITVIPAPSRSPASEITRGMTPHYTIPTLSISENLASRSTFCVCSLDSGRVTSEPSNGLSDLSQQHLFPTRPVVRRRKGCFENVNR